MLTLYGRPNSANVRKVRWVCGELGLSYELIEIGRGVAPTDTPNYRALNPNMTIPTLVDGDFVLWESNAIIRYLAARERAEALLPSDPAKRAIVEQWMDWQSAEVWRQVRVLFFALWLKSEMFAKAELIAEATGNCARLMGLLDRQLAATGAHVAGPNFTVADVSLGVVVHRYLSLPMERPDLPALGAYYRRLANRPAFAETVMIGEP